MIEPGPALAVAARARHQVGLEQPAAKRPNDNLGRFVFWERHHHVADQQLAPARPDSTAIGAVDTETAANAGCEAAPGAGFAPSAMLGVAAFARHQDNG
jgi:hypothetical protein